MFKLKKKIDLNFFQCRDEQRRLRTACCWALRDGWSELWNSNFKMKSLNNNNEENENNSSFKNEEFEQQWIWTACCGTLWNGWSELRNLNFKTLNSMFSSTSKLLISASKFKFHEFENSRIWKCKSFWKFKNFKIQEFKFQEFEQHVVEHFETVDLSFEI